MDFIHVNIFLGNGVPDVPLLWIKTKRYVFDYSRIDRLAPSLLFAACFLEKSGTKKCLPYFRGAEVMAAAPEAYPALLGHRPSEGVRALLCRRAEMGDGGTALICLPQ